MRHGLAGLIDIALAIVAVLILVGIVLVAVRASRDNSIFSALRDVAQFLAGPFDGMFEPRDRRLGVVVSWAIAIVVYVLACRWVSGLLRR